MIKSATKLFVYNTCKQQYEECIFGAAFCEVDQFAATFRYQVETQKVL